MVELRRATRDAVGPDGRPALGRGYEICDDAGEPLALGELAPGAVDEIALVEVIPTSAEERAALRTARFGVGRTVTLRADGAALALLDDAGTARAGRAQEAVADDARALLDERQDLATWVCWEWLAEEGRSGVVVALSRPDLAPQALGPPPKRGGIAGDRRAWLAAAAVIVVLLVGFVSCT